MAAVQTILIAGPTASGKSALALTLAERLGGVVINADSMQVYRELHVLTARPSVADEARAPHRLYGHVPAAEAYSAGRFATEVAHVIAAAKTDRRLPIIVGGTGLYFKTLLEGLSPIPAIPEDVRQRWRKEAEAIGAEELHKQLSSRDPEMAARLMPSDPQRITRALEVLDATGRSLARWQEEPGTPILTATGTVRLVADVAREELNRRCNARFDAMMDGGALDEVRLLAMMGLKENLPAMRALGVRPLMQLLRGEIGRDAAVEAAKSETRQYVKRQLTWLNSNMSAWRRLSTKEMESYMF